MEESDLTWSPFERNDMAQLRQCDVLQARRNFSVDFHFVQKWTTIFLFSGVILSIDIALLTLVIELSKINFEWFVVGFHDYLQRIVWYWLNLRIWIRHHIQFEHKCVLKELFFAKIRLLFTCKIYVFWTCSISLSIFALISSPSYICKLFVLFLHFDC